MYFFENCLAHFSLLRGRGTPKFIKAYIEPVIDLLVNSMVSTNTHVENIIKEILLKEQTTTGQV